MCVCACRLLSRRLPLVGLTQPSSINTEHLYSSLDSVFSAQDGGGRGRGRGRRGGGVGAWGRPSLVLALAKSFGSTLCTAALFKLAQDLLGFASPQLLR